jgi:hypothetical protein
MNYLTQLGMPREAIVPLMTTKATDAVQLRADVEGLVTTKDTHGTLTEKKMKVVSYRLRY